MPRNAFDDPNQRDPSLGDLLTTRPSGLTEHESWAILCQAVQALQDLFLADGVSGGKLVPLVTPNSLLLSNRGRVKLQQVSILRCGPPVHLMGYLAPEFRPTRRYSDTEMEKMWIYGLGETLKRATLTSHAATTRLSCELCRALTTMTRAHTTSRASLMHLLDVISDYCKKTQQNRPFSHIVMDLHQEAMAGVEMAMDTPWGPPAMPDIRTRPRNRCETNTDAQHTSTMPRRWFLARPKLTREASTSMEDISPTIPVTPGALARPKSMCVPKLHSEDYFKEFHKYESIDDDLKAEKVALSRFSNQLRKGGSVGRVKCRRNPVQRAASRLYRAGGEVPRVGGAERECVGPEFVVRAVLPSKKVIMHDIKGSVRKTVTVIMLNGQKLDVVCNPNTTTAAQLFEVIIQKEHIEENFMLGLSALIAGDFVFLPSDTRICKAIVSGNNSHGSTLTLFMRIRFFLPSLRGIRGSQARHLLYLQLRRSILEHQLPCSFNQLVELDGLALQAEFGDYNEREHGSRDYFLLEHYIPETMTSVVGNLHVLRHELTRAHMLKYGTETEKAEHDFIVLAQSLPHYGGHFYTATWSLKDNTQKEIWLYISAQGINLYERGPTTSQCGPKLYENFEWRSIQTLCYSKHYLCILPHCSKLHAWKLKKYKLKMNHKKSYFAFRLASLHHQFFLRLRTEYTSFQSLSQQFGIPVKDIKNETNSLFKLEALTNYELDSATVNAETEFRIEFRNSGNSSVCHKSDVCKRSKSVDNITAMNDTVRHLMGENESHQNKENENPKRNVGELILDSSCLSGLPLSSADKRRGVKMGIRAFANPGQRVSRSMEAVNALAMDDLEQLSLQSVSLHCSSTSISKSPDNNLASEAYVLDSTIKSCSNQFLPDIQETLSASLLDKLNNISFVEERLLQTVTVERDPRGSLGMQITEGSDGKVYVQSVIVGGPAHLTGNVFAGDQIIAVDGRNLLGLAYANALECLKNTGKKVELMLSKSNVHTQSTLRVGDLKGRLNLSNLSELHLNSVSAVNKLKMLSYNRVDVSPVEKHVTESCHDASNLLKYGSPGEVPYHKHIRYEIELENDSLMSQKNLPFSKSNPNPNQINNAVVVGVIPKAFLPNFQMLENPRVKTVIEMDDFEDKTTIPPIALPRSLGLSRKWRGPVRYPVTPVKKAFEFADCDGNYVTTSDDEQVFI